MHQMTKEISNLWGKLKMDRPRNANTHVSETNQRMDYSASTIFFQDRMGSLCKQTFQKSIRIQYNTLLIFWKFLVKLVLWFSFFSLSQQATCACYSESPNLMSQLSNTHANKYFPTRGQRSIYESVHLLNTVISKDPDCSKVAEIQSKVAADTTWPVWKGPLSTSLPERTKPTDFTYLRPPQV